MIPLKGSTRDVYGFRVYGLRVAGFRGIYKGSIRVPFKG